MAQVEASPTSRAVAKPRWHQRDEGRVPQNFPWHRPGHGLALVLHDGMARAEVAANSLQTISDNAGLPSHQSAGGSGDHVPDAGEQGFVHTHHLAPTELTAVIRAPDRDLIRVGLVSVIAVVAVLRGSLGADAADERRSIRVPKLAKTSGQFRSIRNVALHEGLCREYRLLLAAPFHSKHPAGQRVVQGRDGVDLYPPLHLQGRLPQQVRQALGADLFVALASIQCPEESRDILWRRADLLNSTKVLKKCRGVGKRTADGAAAQPVLQF
mmetsp:Transcript_76290/g.182553  ORF Transcript_76290/g.182553 Transcript_76290/m.182553 type:complete len:269 (-) Transcript_76290:970-1776(-)